MTHHTPASRDWHGSPRSLASAEKARIIEKIRDALAPHMEVNFALLHGSFLTDRPFRDIDLAVYVIPAFEGLRRGQYEIDLSTDLAELVRFPVDVRVLNDAPLAFRYHALTGTVLLIRDEELLDEFRARTWDDYFDFAPFARRFLREAIGE